jgi:hypothetical protein
MCCGGISGMIYAKNFLQANPNKKSGYCGSPTATFQLDDFLCKIQFIFGDGSMVLLSVK